MHIVDLLKAHVPVKAKKTRQVKQRSLSQTCPPTSAPVKQPLRRTLTADEITEAELALKRLQAEKKRLEDLLNSASDRHLIYQQQPNTDIANNNNVRKELIRVPRYQQKTAFMLHNVFSDEVRFYCIQITSVGAIQFAGVLNIESAFSRDGFSHFLMFSQ